MQPTGFGNLSASAPTFLAAIAEFESPNFLALNDYYRQARIDLVKMRYLLSSAKIDEAYMQTVLKLNPLVVSQLREVFASKPFQVADERQRQSMFDILLKQPSVSEGLHRIPTAIVERIMREETIDIPGSVLNVMQEIRQVFQSPMFNRFSQADQQRYFELMLKQPQVLKANLTREDLLKAYYEIQANTAAINAVTADPLFLILNKLDPKEVLKTCGLTGQFARLCQNPNLFATLMRLHYPNNLETANPKEQYKAITMGLETTYRIARGDRVVNKDGREYFTTFKDPVQYGKTQLRHRIPGFKLKLYGIEDVKRFLGLGYIPLALRQLVGQEDSVLYSYIINQSTNFTATPEEVEKLYAAGEISDYQLQEGKPDDYLADYGTEVVFSVKGYPIPAVTKAWLLILESHAACIEDEVQVFKTKEALAKSFIQNEYPLFKERLIENFSTIINDELLDLIDGLEPEEAEKVLLPTPQWKTYLERAQLPHPFSPKKVYQYLLQNDHIQIFPDSERDSWLLREVTF